MQYLLILILLTQSSCFARWNPEDDYWIKSGYDLGCVGESQCYSKLKSQNLDLESSVKAGACAKEREECNLVLQKIKDNYQAHTPPQTVPYFIPYPIFINNH